MNDLRQPSDCVCYDQDGNVIRVIAARKRTSPKQNKLDNQRKLHKLRQLEPRKKS